MQSEIEKTEQSIFGMHFNYKKQAYETSMSGTHQVQNMTTVIEAVNVLKNKGYNITGQNIKDGIRKTILPARVEVISKKPLVILDGGHNEDGAKAFYEAVKECFNNDKKLFVIAGMMNDKAVEASLKPLISQADTFVAVTPENPRAMKAEALAEKLKAINPNIVVNVNIGDITSTNAVTISSIADCALLLALLLTLSQYKICFNASR